MLFEEPNPEDFFLVNGDYLRAYLESNDKRGRTKTHVTFVVQNNKLQCLNGAYFAQLDQHLAPLIIRNLSTGCEWPRPQLVHHCTVLPSVWAKPHFGEMCGEIMDIVGGSLGATWITTSS
jgi:hypothetical protein